jgi:hypothetical protein
MPRRREDWRSVTTSPEVPICQGHRALQQPVRGSYRCAEEVASRRGGQVGKYLRWSAARGVPMAPEACVVSRWRTR